MAAAQQALAGAIVRHLDLESTPMTPKPDIEPVATLVERPAGYVTATGVHDLSFGFSASIVAPNLADEQFNVPLYPASALLALEGERDEVTESRAMLIRTHERQSSRLETAEAEVARLREALRMLLSSVEGVLVELKPGQSLSPSGAGRTNALIADRNAARRALSSSEHI
jgi:hypothetical protein